LKYKKKLFKVKKGENYGSEDKNLAKDVTYEMFADGSYKNLKFKSMNYNSLGLLPNTGALHPLQKIRTEFQQIFIEMGFEEMETNKYLTALFGILMHYFSLKHILREVRMIPSLLIPKHLIFLKNI